VERHILRDYFLGGQRAESRPPFIRAARLFLNVLEVKK
jgi:hypothetical protein